MTEFDRANALLKEFKENSYSHGVGVLSSMGVDTKTLGSRAVLVATHFPGSQEYIDQISNALARAEVELIAKIPGASPNAPCEDLSRITNKLSSIEADLVISFGGGSTIDAVKAAIVLSSLGGSVDDYFGTGLVTKAIAEKGKKLIPHLAIQTAASSAAHLTKYSNITNIKTGQKKLIVDQMIVPPRSIFDYSITIGAPAALTSDGALDGVSHCLEVLYSTVDKPEYEKVKQVALEGIRLAVKYLPQVIKNPKDGVARHALGLATDLGGYAIMLGGTNGAHLTSFSLVDILSHGRACAMLNPYYTVLFAPAVEDALREVGLIYFEAGYTKVNINKLSGRELGVAVAEAMIAFEESIGFPTTLQEVPGFTDEHILRVLTAAKDPQLKMKLENMPIPLTPEMVEDAIGPVLYAARDGDLRFILNIGK